MWPLEIKLAPTFYTRDAVTATARAPDENQCLLLISREKYAGTIRILLPRAGNPTKDEAEAAGAESFAGVRRLGA
jgi:hypothetical protein